MINIDDIKSKLKDELPYLKDTYDVEKLGIFGSIARGDNTQYSDIDILVKFTETPGFLRFIKLEEELSNITQNKVDLVTETALKPQIRADILKEIIYV